MIANELINQMIPPLKTSDTVQLALNWMKEFRLSQLVVVENDLYVGMISEEVLIDANDINKKIGDFALDFQDVFSYPQSHFYDIIKLATKHNVQIVAVVDENKHFQGVISINDATSATAKLFASHGPGGILIIALRQNDYSLSEISRLIESNEVKILSSFVINDELDPTMIKLTLKLNKEDLSRVIATLERYNYNVIAHFHESEFLSDDKERLDLLFRYLNI